MALTKMERAGLSSYLSPVGGFKSATVILQVKEERGVRHALSIYNGGSRIRKKQAARIYRETIVCRNDYSDNGESDLEGALNQRFTDSAEQVRLGTLTG